MYFTQYYLDCLCQASYLIGDEATGLAVVVDPRRDVAEYLDDAAAHGLTIVGVINTHFHADFLSGHLELAQETGAWIGYGSAAQADFEVRHLADGERIAPRRGHPRDHGDARPHAGVDLRPRLRARRRRGPLRRPDRRRAVHRRRRPADLLASIGVTADELGRMLYHSVQQKLMGLPDAVRVFPAHGAGSACGKNLSTERSPPSASSGRSTTPASRCPRTRSSRSSPRASRRPRPTSSSMRPSTARSGTSGHRRLGAGPRRCRGRRRPSPAAPSSTTPARSTSSRRPTCVARSTCPPTGGWPRPSGWCSTRPAGRRHRPRGPGAGGRHPVRPDRLRPGARLPPRPRGLLPAHEDRRAPGEPAHRRRGRRRLLAAGEVQLVDIRNAGEVEAGWSPVRRHIPLAELAARADELDAAAARSWSTAPAAGAARWAPACCAARASPTSPTSSAATAPGSACTPWPPL